MLDLSRISTYEPFEIGELRIFQFDGSNDIYWKRAWEDLTEHCKDHRISLNAYSASLDAGRAHQGDLNLVALSSGAVKDSPQVFLEQSKNWRFRDSSCYFKLVRYSSKLEIPSDQKKHWLHYVMTPLPDAYPYSNIQYV